MLLSMLASFLLARKFKGKVYISLMIVVLIIVSVFSIGFPTAWRSSIGSTTVWKLNLSNTPLSFPFHAYISEEFYLVPMIYPNQPRPPIYNVKLYFFGFPIGSVDFIILTTSYLLLLASFFLLVNLAGAIFGYWISKSTFIDKLLKKG